MTNVHAAHYNRPAGHNSSRDGSSLRQLTLHWQFLQNWQTHIGLGNMPTAPWQALWALTHWDKDSVTWNDVVQVPEWFSWHSGTLTYQVPMTQAKVAGDTPHPSLKPSEWIFINDELQEVTWLHLIIGTLLPIPAAPAFLLCEFEGKALPVLLLDPVHLQVGVPLLFAMGTGLWACVRSNAQEAWQIYI